MMDDIYREVLPRNLLMFGSGGFNIGGGGSPGGDYPILDTRQLPTNQSSRGIYNLLQDFNLKTQNAYELGVPPPEAPTAEALMRWRALTSPWAEEQILNNLNSQQLSKKRKETVGI
jgi:hypothetical protein